MRIMCSVLLRGFTCWLRVIKMTLTIIIQSYTGNSNSLFPAQCDFIKNNFFTKIHEKCEIRNNTIYLLLK